MDRSQNTRSIMSFAMDETDMSFGFPETQKSLRKKFKRLKVDSSTQASMSLTKTSGQQSDYQISLLNFSIDMESTLSRPISSIAFSETNGIDLSNFVKDKKRQRTCKEDESSLFAEIALKRIKTPDLRSDMSCSSDFTLGGYNLRNGTRNSFDKQLPLCYEKSRRQKELHRLRMSVQKKHLKLLEMQMEQTRAMFKNEEKLFEKNFKILKLELEILQRSTGNN